MLYNSFCCDIDSVEAEVAVRDKHAMTTHRGVSVQVFRGANVN